MSEEEIIKDLKNFCVMSKKEENFTYYSEYKFFKEMAERIQGLLDLYNKEKEKNKELENCLQMAKQIMTADISEDFNYMKLKQFKEYLLNEIKLNENFEE